jgi:hypothetical protein
MSEEVKVAEAITAVADPPKAAEALKPVEEPKLTPEQVTEAYLEARMEGKTADLPFVEPTIKEEVKSAVVEAPPEAPPPSDTDQYLEQRQQVKEEKRKRKARGGEQARIDELTKKAADLERANEELTKKAAEVIKPPVAETPKPAIVEETKPVAVIPKQQPRINEYENIDDYQAAMALWAADERAKTVAKEPPKAVEPPIVNQSLQVRKEEFDKFLEKGRAFIVGHPDFNTILEAAHVRGLTLSENARIAITRLAVPEVAYWLAKPENDLAARALMGMDDLQQVVEVGRIAERLAVSPADFVSNAPAPGMRLTNATTRSTVPISALDTDDYIRMRKEQRRATRGRR